MFKAEKMRGYSPIPSKIKKPAPAKAAEDSSGKSQIKPGATKGPIPARMVGTSAPPKAVYLNAPLRMMGDSTLRPGGPKKHASDKKQGEKKPAQLMPKEHKPHAGSQAGVIHLGQPHYSVGVHSIAGKSDGRSKTNQDAYYIDTEMSENSGMSLFGVFDGHGFHGHRVSNFLVSNIRDIFEIKYSSSGSINYEETFVELCHSLNKMLKKNIYIDTKLSGSTGIMVLVTKNSVICSNVGDSRALLVRRAQNGHLEHLELSVDQKPSDPQEKQRIISQGGRIHPCRSRLDLISAHRKVYRTTQDMDKR
jgi:Protein phosphatase 2C